MLVPDGNVRRRRRRRKGTVMKLRKTRIFPACVLRGKGTLIG
jgi:hypothetical protein